MHRDNCCRRHPVGTVSVEVGQISVEGPTGDAAHLIVLKAGRAKAHSRVQDGEVHAEFIHALAQELWEGDCGSVEGVRGGEVPKCGAFKPYVPAFLLGHQVPPAPTEEQF